MALTDEAMLRIKQMIQNGELGPGDRLPPEQDLAERLGLSRSSLREAVKALEAMRILDVRRGDGTYVTSLEPTLLLEATSFVLDLHQSTAVLEVFAVRRILEQASARAAAQYASDDDVTALRDLLDGVGADTDIEALVEHDLAFHRRIAACGGNDYLVSLLETVSNRTARARVWRGMTQEHAVERTLGEHAHIVAAIERHDADLAEALMTVHVCGVEEWLRAQIAAENTPAD